MMTLIEEWNYQELWLLARCPEELAQLETLMLQEGTELALKEGLQSLLLKAESLSPNPEGLRVAFSNIWLSLEVWANDQEAQAYQEMIDDASTYADLEEFLLQMLESYQPEDLINTRFYVEKGL